jgi:hypothetical protein
VVGLLDWCEPDPPTAESIANSAVLRYGNAHVKTVGETGGMLLGHGEPPVVAGLADRTSRLGDTGSLKTWRIITSDVTFRSSLRWRSSARQASTAEIPI